MRRWGSGRHARTRAATEVESERRDRELRVLTAITMAISEHFALQEVLDAVTEGAAELLTATLGHLTLVDLDGTTLRLAAATGPMLSHVGAELPREGSMPGWAITSGTPLVVNDLAADARGYAPINRELRLQRSVVVPLRAHAQVIGALGCDNVVGSPPFTAQDVELLERLALHAVMAIDTAHLLQRAEVARTRLERQNAELAQGARTKGTFLANVSHELRTPLNAIIGFSDLLGAGALGPLSPSQQDSVETIVRNSRHLLALINDVLDIAKVEAGKLELHLVRADVREAVEGVLRDAGSLATRKRQRVVAEVGAEPLVVVADEVRVRQVLFNLVSNAVKFTPEDGEITVRIVRTTTPLPTPAQRAADRAGGTALVPRDAVWVAVRDTGPGIRAEDMERLFHEFSQVNPEHNRQHEGSGLGLALCKRFVELHGGTIGADSVYGLGSTFWFILPVDGPLRRPATATVTVAPSLAS